MVFLNVVLASVSFYSAFLYRTKWLSNDRFDNLYVTFTVLDLDERRKEVVRPSIMPLMFDEERKYVQDCKWNHS